MFRPLTSAYAMCALRELASGARAPGTPYGRRRVTPRSIKLVDRMPLATDDLVCREMQHLELAFGQPWFGRRGRTQPRIRPGEQAGYVFTVPAQDRGHPPADQLLDQVPRVVAPVV